MPDDAPVLTLAEVDDLVARALRDRLDRDLLLGVLGRTKATLPLHRAPDDQLRSDLLHLACASPSPLGRHPVLVWLEAAEHMSRARGSNGVAYYSEVTARVESRLGDTKPLSVGQEPETLPHGFRGVWLGALILLWMFAVLGSIWWSVVAVPSTDDSDASSALRSGSDGFTRLPAPTTGDAGVPVLSSPSDAEPATAPDVIAEPMRRPVFRKKPKVSVRIFTEEDARVEIRPARGGHRVFVGRAHFGNASDPAYTSTNLAPGRYLVTCDPGRGEQIDRAAFEVSTARLEIDCKTGVTP